MAQNAVALDTMITGERAWLTAREAAQRARCGVKIVYRAAKRGRLRAAHVGERGELRFRPAWVDEWLESLVPRG